MPDNGEIVVTMYRQTDDRKVWYEWMVEVYTLERITTATTKLLAPAMSGARSTHGIDSLNNKDQGQHSQGNGNSRAGYRRVRVGMSDLHSSIKDGCLM